jgi:hypothetical protein
MHWDASLVVAHGLNRVKAVLDSEGGFASPLNQSQQRLFLRCAGILCSVLALASAQPCSGNQCMT